MTNADEALAPDPLVVETVERLLGDACDVTTVEAAEAAGWFPAGWDALAESGFPWVSVPEGAGGSGGSLTDAFAILRSVGRHAAPVPVAETGILGGWLAAEAGFAIPAAAVTVADPAGLRVDGTRLVGQLPVAWASRSERILGVVDGPAGPVIFSARPDQVTIEARRSMSGEPRDHVSFDVEIGDLQTAPAPPGVDAQALRRRGCLSRVVLSAGALEAMTQLTVDYTNARRQFGRPVAQFQAVQQHLVTVAQCSVRASMAADVAVRAVARGGGQFEVAAARVVLDDAAVLATRSAHQAHGAMGVTREYGLQMLSRRLWAWRHEWGPASYWRRWLGSEVAAVGADAFYPLVTA